MKLELEINTDDPDVLGELRRALWAAQAYDQASAIDSAVESQRRFGRASPGDIREAVRLVLKADERVEDVACHLHALPEPEDRDAEYSYSEAICDAYAAEDLLDDAVAILKRLEDAVCRD